jgi:predicted nucleic acid-binding protein
LNLCVDTSAYSAFKRGHEAVVEALARADELVITPIVLGELIAGFKAGSRERRNREELQRFLASPRVRVASMDEGTAERYGEILVHLRKSGTPIPTNDIWIAATAMQLGLAVLTTDLHFSRIPQVITELLDA